MKSNTKTDTVEIIFSEVFRGIFSFVKTIYYGSRKMKSIKVFAVFLLLAGMSAIIYIKKELILLIDAPAYIGWIILCALLVSPLLFLFILGCRQMQDVQSYYRAFENIGFIGKDKKQDGKKEILSFKSFIPLDTWKRAIPDLETALDRTILRIESPESKQKVKLITIGSEYKIPVNISWSDEYLIRDDSVLVIGENAFGSVTIDLNAEPHVLAAGQTGSGKSVILREMLWQLAKKGAVLFMLDFKGGVEFGLEYENYGEVITERKEAAKLLGMLVEENKKRLELIRSVRAKNLRDYNERTGENLSRICVFCDEIGEMLDAKGASAENKKLIEQLTGALSTIARLGRAPGINLFLGVQRPDANVLNGQIKNNVPVRICGRFADKSASEIVLGNTYAADLPEIKGRFLFQVGADTEEFQAYYFNDDKMLGDIGNMEYNVMLPELARYSVLLSNTTGLKASGSRGAQTLELPEVSDKIERPKKRFNYDDEAV